MGAANCVELEDINHLLPVRDELGVAVVQALSLGRAVGRQQVWTPGRWPATPAAVCYQMTGPTMDDLDPDIAGRALWQADSDRRVSLSRVGYLSEMCRSLAGWDTLSSSDDLGNPMLNAQRSVHAACDGFELDTQLIMPERTCFTVLSDDIQTPWVESELTAGAQIDVSEAGKHGHVDIPECG
ncbi:hypothetical protein [Cellulomonas iranensis]|uniref:hypothetical protein n=1 Tax=Cellulomonas iranensis TaxID=76862 RepID=UPI003D7EB7D4